MFLFNKIGNAIKKISEGITIQNIAVDSSITLFTSLVS